VKQELWKKTEGCLEVESTDDPDGRTKRLCIRHHLISNAVIKSTASRLSVEENDLTATSYSKCILGEYIYA